MSLLESLDSSGIRNVSFVGRVGTDILAGMLDVAASTGSACHAGEITLSPVLKAMGVVPGVGLGPSASASGTAGRTRRLRRSLAD